MGKNLEPSAEPIIKDTVMVQPIGSDSFFLVQGSAHIVSFAQDLRSTMWQIQDKNQRFAHTLGHPHYEKRK